MANKFILQIHNAYVSGFISDTVYLRKIINSWMKNNGLSSQEGFWTYFLIEWLISSTSDGELNNYWCDCFYMCNLTSFFLIVYNPWPHKRCPSILSWSFSQPVSGAHKRTLWGSIIRASIPFTFIYLFLF